MQFGGLINYHAIWWLKTTAIIFLTVLETRSPNQGASRVVVGESLSLALSSPLPSVSSYDLSSVHSGGEKEELEANGALFGVSLDRTIIPS